MSSNVANQSAFLRTSRNFPEVDLHQLAVELNKAYIDIANTVNSRTISIFPTQRKVVNGENWYFNNQRQQGFRQIYPFTTAPSTIPHNIDFASVSQFTKCSGSYTDGTNWYGAIYASNVGIAGQISFYVDPTNIVILSGGGIPAITTGTIVLEYIANV